MRLRFGEDPQIFGQCVCAWILQSQRIPALPITGFREGLARRASDEDIRLTHFQPCTLQNCTRAYVLNRGFDHWPRTISADSAASGGVELDRDGSSETSRFETEVQTADSRVEAYCGKVFSASRCHARALMGHWSAVDQTVRSDILLKQVRLV